MIRDHKYEAMADALETFEELDEDKSGDLTHYEVLELSNHTPEGLANELRFFETDDANALKKLYDDCERKNGGIVTEDIWMCFYEEAFDVEVVRLVETQWKPEHAERIANR